MIPSPGAGVESSKMQGFQPFFIAQSFACKEANHLVFFTPNRRTNTRTPTHSKSHLNTTTLTLMIFFFEAIALLMYFRNSIRNKHPVEIRHQIK